MRKRAHSDRTNFFEKESFLSLSFPLRYSENKFTTKDVLLLRREGCKDANESGLKTYSYGVFERKEPRHADDQRRGAETTWKERIHLLCSSIPVTKEKR
jgi:hypothetical protein